MARFKSRLMFLVLSVLVVSECVGNSILTAPKKEWDNVKSGLIVASLGYDRSSPDPFPAWAENPAVHVYVKSITDPKSVTMELSTSAGMIYGDAWKHAEVVIDDGNRRRLVVAYPAAPGRYKLWKKFSKLLAGYRGNYEFTQNEEMPMLFDVKAGEITYIGCHELTMSTRKSPIGIELPRLGIITLVDRYEADLNLLNQLRPKFVGATSTNAIQEPK